MNAPGSDLTAELIDRITAAVTGVEGVRGLDPGADGEIAVYLPGRRAYGVRMGEYGRVEVHIVAAYGSDVRDVAERVRREVRTVAGGPVDVVVEDIGGPSPAVDAGTV